MRFEWDEQKNLINIRKHGFDFAHAERMFAGPTPIVTDADFRDEYSEERWIGFGMINDIVAVIVFVLPAEDTVRVISLRKADKDEQKYYYTQAF
jgi:uncharacterized protein